MIAEKVELLEKLAAVRKIRPHIYTGTGNINLVLEYTTDEGETIELPTEVNKKLADAIKEILPEIVTRLLERKEEIAAEVAEEVEKLISPLLNV